MFQLTAEEVTSLRSQIAASNKGRGERLEPAAVFNNVFDAIRQMMFRNYVSILGVSRFRKERPFEAELTAGR